MCGILVFSVPRYAAMGAAGAVSYIRLGVAIFNGGKPTMERVRLRQKLADKPNFVVCVELTGGPGFNYGPIEKFLQAYQGVGSAAIPKGFDFELSVR